MRVKWLALVGALALGGCSTAPPTPSPAATWVAVYGPAISRWTPTQAMSLEIGDSAWSITPEGGLGVAAADLIGPARVRLVGVGDCHVYAEFEATPGSRYAIQFGRLGSPETVTVQEVEQLELGPGLNARIGGLTDCE